MKTVAVNLRRDAKSPAFKLKALSNISLILFRGRAN